METLCIYFMSDFSLPFLEINPAGGIRKYSIDSWIGYLDEVDLSIGTDGYVTTGFGSPRQT